MPTPHSQACLAFRRLLEIMDTLRSPGGCPWDAEQTPESLKPYLIEETYEVIEAIDQGCASSIKEELGDLLLQIVFQTRIFEERQAFTMADVADGIADKLVRRHPHVFDEVQTLDLEELNTQWDRIKAREKSKRGEASSALGNLPRQLPALLRAAKINEKAARAGYDPGSPLRRAEQARTHLEALNMELGTDDKERLGNLFGSLFFELAGLASALGHDPEEALRSRIDGFVEGFETQDLGLKEKEPSPSILSAGEGDILKGAGAKKRGTSKENK
ncbi:MAG: nucleoside triphosphate pyrophosphohydrolase [Desulfuromonas sp.]|uniref:nucleoside triphosphate pyrophosphohydrolase n=1 Tax=Desulfuromonas sp. TaxID=892 RepID=UPI000CC1C066|nr:nucleoside triphosphate pyrophosphohydrolase [Desulfuromonas sp.]PLX81892.1 MAG: nucleoside triphosphate pyrophosphohydrolase [Desulfuromonas sp.]